MTFSSEQKRKGSILVVDDNPSIGKLIKQYLESFGHTVDPVETGEDALGLLSSRTYDIVITDIVLPGLDGMGVLEEVKSKDPSIEVIVITGYASIESAVQFMKAGALDYITKPISRDHLDIVIQKALERKDLIRAAGERDKYLKLSLTDSLTGLYNHKYFQEHLARELVKSKRCGTNCSLLLLDVDNFKSINDSLGHQAGDRVLRDIADRISHTRRAYDIIARYGGEEFAIIMPESDTQNAKSLAERILPMISDNKFENLRSPVTVSIGIASAPVHAHSREDLIQKADIALYHSKWNGKNRYSVYDDEMEKNVG